jgi:signal transduction histidine kinase
MSGMTATHWLTAAGFVTWVAGSIPAVLAIANGRMTGIAAVVWVAAFVAFGVALGAVCFERNWAPRRERALVLIQSVAASVMVAVTRDGVAGAALVVAASQLPGLVSSGVAAAWVGAHTAVIAGRFWWLDGPLSAFIVGGAYLGFQMFAMATSTLALRERTAREELARTNAELHATRALLVEDSRVAERLRISRDLHDMLGHHLTALSLQLEVASRLASGAAADRVTEAHAITRLLLGDVRDVVSQLRDRDDTDLGSAIRTLAAAAVRPEVHVQIEEGIAINDPVQKHALLRCVQEIITNAMRHADASNLWIAIERRAGGIALAARDDGRGVEIVTYGHGLRGMRERFEELAGHVEFSSKPGGGFHITAFMPGDASHHELESASAP